MTTWWRDRAKCRGRNPRYWDLAGRTHLDAETAARTICRGCPVIAECALDAIDHGDAGVIRAGVCLWPRGHGSQRDADTHRLREIARGSS